MTNKVVPHNHFLIYKKAKDKKIKLNKKQKVVSCIKFDREKLKEIKGE